MEREFEHGTFANIKHAGFYTLRMDSLFLLASTNMKMSELCNFRATCYGGKWRMVKVRAKVCRQACFAIREEERGDCGGGEDVLAPPFLN